MVCAVKGTALAMLVAGLVAVLASVAAAGGGVEGHRVVVAAGLDVAGAPASAPYAINSTSLTQSGQQLSWQVTLSHPFTAASLQLAGRSLCLELQRVRSGAVTGELCVGLDRGLPALRYAEQTRTGLGPASVIEATISRPSPEQMTATFLPAAIGSAYTELRWQALSGLLQTSCGTRGAPAGCPPLTVSVAGVTKLHVPVLVGCVPAGPSLVYRGSGALHEIALTFDDGPWSSPPTIDFVNLLAQYHVPGTFFEIGRQIPEYDPTGGVQRAMLAGGDMIGDHTWSHPDMLGLSTAAQTAELEQTASAIRRATGFTPCLWRPPYGATDPQLESLARSLGFLTIMWDVDPQDWALPGVDAIYGNVVAHANDGAIVIQHFGGGPRYETLTALPQEIKTLRARGYQFVTVAQLLGLQLVYK